MLRIAGPGFSLCVSTGSAGPHPYRTFSQTTCMSIIRKYMSSAQPILKAILGVGLFIAFLSGCAVGPDYQPPQTSTPAQWTSQMSGGETNDPVNLAQWWKSFGDTNLDS